MWNCILVYSGTYGSLFLNKKDSGLQEKESIIRMGVG